MKTGLLVLLSVLLAQTVFAQRDSVSVLSKHAEQMDRIASSRAYRMTYIAVPLIAGGLIVQGRDKGFRAMREHYAPSLRTHYDDYLQYAPAGLMVGLKAFGVKGRSSWGRMLVSDAFSAAIMAISVNSIKYTALVRRPDGSNRHSFPSGHTATAFMTATMLHKEYGQRSPWYSVAGYTMATATGVGRMLNNKHWLSDVMVGAGIGILATELGYLFADLIFKDKGISLYDQQYTYDPAHKPSFVGLNMGVNLIAGAYNPYPDARVRFSAGVDMAIEGAWFATYYLGLGGRFGIASSPVELNGVALTDRLESVSGYIGPYFSYPVASRWLTGGKVLFGYEHFGDLKYGPFDLGKGSGFAFGTGLSMTFRASPAMDVRFSSSYYLLPSMRGEREERLHMVSFGTSMNISF